MIRVSKLSCISIIVCLIPVLASCPADMEDETVTAIVPGSFVEFATSDIMWTGVAVSSNARVFVNYPRWSPDIPFSVAEIDSSGQPVAFPDKLLNGIGINAKSEDTFVCVQSVYIDDEDTLWVLDPANPFFGGVMADAVKLIAIDISTPGVKHTYRFDEPVVRRDSYLNDVRVDRKKNVAYITDSGDGAILVLDLVTGESRRLLDNHHSTGAEDVVLNIGGSDWLYAGGSKPQVHSDGLALSPDREYLYYQALTGRTLYRIPTEVLCNEELAEEDVAAAVKVYAKSGASDGIAFGPDGYLYLTSLEHNAIRRIGPDRTVEMVVESPKLSWPDSICFMRDGRAFVTTSQIHRAGTIKEPYRIFSFRIPVTDH